MAYESGSPVSETVLISPTFAREISRKPGSSVFAEEVMSLESCWLERISSLLMDSWSRLLFDRASMIDYPASRRPRLLEVWFSLKLTMLLRLIVFGLLLIYSFATKFIWKTAPLNLPALNSS